jgi:dihydroxy-acid dehydratase
MPLRSNFEPGTSRWATRRAQWRALGLTDEDMVKPKIAIVNSSSQLAICFSHLDEIARRARRAVQQVGGVAFEVRNKGIVVGEVSPEAARGGPLALVRDDDPIRIDVPARTADLDVPGAELQHRRDALRAPARSEERGWLSIYQRLVRPLPEGAVLREPAP